MTCDINCHLKTLISAHTNINPHDDFILINQWNCTTGLAKTVHISLAYINKKFQCTIVKIFLCINFNICFGCSK